MVPGMGALQYSRVRLAVAQSDLTAIGQYMFWLMFRNVASDGLVFQDPRPGFGVRVAEAAGLPQATRTLSCPARPPQGG